MLSINYQNFLKDISVVLSGSADELFGGYGRIFSSANDYLKVNETGVNNLNDTFKKNILKKYKLNSFNSEIDFFLDQYSYIQLVSKKELLNKDTYNSLNYDFLNKSYFSEKWNSLDELNLPEKFMWIFQKIHIQGLLNRLDAATMSASVEGRVPFVDHRLVEYVNKLPFELKILLEDDEAKKCIHLNSDQISEKYVVTKYLLRLHLFIFTG